MVIFADVRGSTEIGERLGPAEFAALLNRFYKAAMDVLVPAFAIIDKMIGDEVMAWFVPVLGPDYRERAVKASIDLSRAMLGQSGQDAVLPVGIAVHSGPAYVGKVGSGNIHDFTALGDTVNTAARMQAYADAGEVIISEDLYDEVRELYPDLEQRTLNLRGRQEPIQVRVISSPT